MEFPVNIDLAPCPFCNKKDNLWIDVFNADFSCIEYWVQTKCKNCGLTIGNRGTFSNKEDAIHFAQQWWNEHLMKF